MTEAQAGSRPSIRDSTTPLPALAAADRITLPPARRPVRRPDPIVGVPGAAGLRRPRLTSVLDRLLGARICAVVAPAGAGKTTALTHWVEATGADVAWFRAGQDPDDAAAALVRGLGAAVHAVDPSLPQAHDLTSLVETCGLREARLVLVVDDFHHLASAETGAVLERLLLETDDLLHLVVASRTPPPLNLARTEISSVVLGPADLRFRSGETAALYRQTYALPLSEPDARLLTRRTGGWAAGLHLFHHTVDGLAPEVRHRSVRALGRRDDYAREYLAQTVLSGIGDDDLLFLQSTSTLETLTGDLCDGLLGVTDSQERLAGLRRHGIVVPAETGPGYRTPEVLRTHLLAAMRSNVGDDLTDSWFQATSALLVAGASRDTDGLSAAAAVRAAVAGHDWIAALTILNTHWSSVVGDPDLDWIDDLPAALSDRGVRVARAVRACRDGALQAAATWAGPDAATGNDPIAETARTIAHFSRTWSVGDLQPGGHWSDYLRAACRRPAPERRTALPPAQADVLRAFELTIAGAWAEARELLTRCTDRVDHDPVTGCVVDLLAAALRPRDPVRAEAIAARAEDLGQPWLARIAHGLASALRGGDDGRSEAVDTTEARGDQWGALLLAGAGAVGHLRAGKPAQRAFDDLVRRCRDLDAPALEAWARCGAALSAAATHQPDSAREVDSAIGFAHSAQVPGALAVAYAASALDPTSGWSHHERRRLAEDEATRVGLDVRPWEWLDAASACNGPGSVSVEVIERVAPVEVSCFGGFDLVVDGTAPDLSRVRPRARALLRLLALYAGQAVHREVIVEAMWPQLDGAAATHNLHVCVSNLRSALEPGTRRGASRLIIRDGERYLLALPDGGVCDLRTFDTCTAAAEQARKAGAADIAIADLDAALRLYTGDVLPEDGPTEWVLPHREHYKVRAAEAAAMLGRLHLDQGRPEDAAAAARRSIDIDPCRDASWRLLVAAHHAAGDLAASEEARRSYAEVLTSLGVASSAATAIRSRS